MKRLLLALALAGVTGNAVAAEAIGRLFFTPAERAQLDNARVQKQRPATKTEEPTEQAPPQTLTYSGMVRRSDGRAVLWLNDRPVDAKEAMSSLSVSGVVRSDGAVVVRVPQSGKTVDLKVGQSVELGSGAVAERGARGVTPSAPTAKPAPEPERAPADADRKDGAAPGAPPPPAPGPAAQASEPPRPPR